MRFGIAGLLVAGIAHAQAAPVSAGRDVLERMHHAYDGAWYHTLTFNQRTIVTRSGAAPDTAIWYESLSGPARLRIDFGDPAAGNGVLYTADSSYSMKNGALLRTSPGGNPFLPLIMGVYLQPLDETVHQLADFGFDLSKSCSGTWRGRAVTIVGVSAAADSIGAQFWIDDGRQVVVRVRGAVRGIGGLDIHLDGYERVGRAWLSTRVSMANPAQRRVEEYYDWKVGVPLAEDLFDIAKWRTAPHWAPPRKP